jgi:hypothetical protein
LSKTNFPYHKGHIDLNVFYPGTPVSSTYKTNRYDTDELLLKVALNTIKQTNKPFSSYRWRQID